MKLRERQIRRRRAPRPEAALSATSVVGWQAPIVPYLFSGPAVLAISVVLAFPVLYAVYQSLFAVSPLSDEAPFVGLANYTRLFAASEFWSALGRTGVFVAGCIVLGIVLAVIFGFALNRVVSGLRFVRGLAILPYIVSSVAAALMFRTLFNSDFGLPNRALELIGLEGLPWFSTPGLAMLVVIVAQVWTDLPLALLFVLGGLQTIDESYIDAAKVDGATGLKAARYISLPLIAPQLILATVFLSYKSLTSLGTVLALTGGGPGTATQLLTLEMVRVGFNEYDMGTALAIVVIIFALNAALTLLYLRLQRRFGVE